MSLLIAPHAGQSGKTPSEGRRGARRRESSRRFALLFTARRLALTAAVAQWCSAAGAARARPQERGNRIEDGKRSMLTTSRPAGRARSDRALRLGWSAIEDRVPEA
jgi:hypothetical protein